MSTSWQRGAAIKHANVVQSQKSTLEDVHAFGVFAIDPPGEVKEKFLEDALQKNRVADTATLLLDLVNTPGSPWALQFTSSAEV